MRNSTNPKAVVYNHVVMIWFCNTLFKTDIIFFSVFKNELEVIQGQHHNKSTYTYFSERERKISVKNCPTGDYT